ncbi:MAG: suppressor of fused domain protein [Myxococcales bacterium]|nr:suppressor of fused domain protein [Myxococcales bacterium]MCB9737148.1 suppressor of fused domain protein [Deltaproteobacteria bacterium]
MERPRPCWFVVTEGAAPPTPLEGRRGMESLELTLQVPRDPASDEPPAWIWDAMTNFVHYLLGKGMSFEDGDYFDFRTPVGEGGPSAFVFIAEPRLARVDEAQGVITFLRAVALQRDELDALRAWRSEPFVALLREAMPDLSSAPTRPSILADRAVAERVAQGTARDGSGFAVRSAEVSLELSSDDRVATVELGAGTAQELPEAFASQLPRGRPIILVDGTEGRAGSVVFGPGELGWHVDRRELPTVTVVLDDAVATRLLAALAARRPFQDPALPGLTVRVAP